MHHVDELKIIGYQEAKDRLLKMWKTRTIGKNLYSSGCEELLGIYMNEVLGEFFNLFDVYWRLDDCYQFEGILE